MTMPAPDGYWVSHCLWSNDGPGLRYAAGDWRPWVLDSYDSAGKIVRTHLACYPDGMQPTGLYLRSLKTRNRVNLESQLAMEQYK